MNNENLNQLIIEALAIEARNAKEAGALGFMARAMVQATMPHKKVKGNEFTRKNGAFTLSILSPSGVGLPYGSIPRLLMAWLTTEAVRTKNRTLCLGDTLSSFMRKIDLVPTGGRWGSITRLRDQTKRLFTASVFCSYETNICENGQGFFIADKYSLWWDPQSPEQLTLFDSTVQLSESFYNELINHPVPIDVRAIRALKKSPLALDIYCWLTYRMSYLKTNSVIPWEVLQLQFGSDYTLTNQGKRNFKQAFLRELKKIITIYCDVKLEANSQALILKPSKTHITKKLII
jgi:hypothetical protein